MDDGQRLLAAAATVLPVGHAPALLSPTLGDTPASLGGSFPGQNLSDVAAGIGSPTDAYVQHMRGRYIATGSFGLPDTGAYPPPLVSQFLSGGVGMTSTLADHYKDAMDTAAVASYWQSAAHNALQQGCLHAAAAAHYGSTSVHYASGAGFQYGGSVCAGLYGGSTSSLAPAFPLLSPATADCFLPATSPNRVCKPHDVLQSTAPRGQHHVAAKSEPLDSAIAAAAASGSPAKKRLHSRERSRRRKHDKKNVELTSLHIATSGDRLKVESEVCCIPSAKTTVACLHSPDIAEGKDITATTASTSPDWKRIVGGKRHRNDDNDDESSVHKSRKREGTVANCCHQESRSSAVAVPESGVVVLENGDGSEEAMMAPLSKDATASKHITNKQVEKAPETSPPLYQYSFTQHVSPLAGKVHATTFTPEVATGPQTSSALTRSLSGTIPVVSTSVASASELGADDDTLKDSLNSKDGCVIDHKCQTCCRAGKSCCTTEKSGRDTTEGRHMLRVADVTARVRRNSDSAVKANSRRNSLSRLVDDGSAKSNTGRTTTHLPGVVSTKEESSAKQSESEREWAMDTCITQAGNDNRGATSGTEKVASSIIGMTSPHLSGCHDVIAGFDGATAKDHGKSSLPTLINKNNKEEWIVTNGCEEDMVAKTTDDEQTKVVVKTESSAVTPTVCEVKPSTEKISAEEAPGSSATIPVGIAIARKRDTKPNLSDVDERKDDLLSRRAPPTNADYYSGIEKDEKPLLSSEFSSSLVTVCSETSGAVIPSWEHCASTVLPPPPPLLRPWLAGAAGDAWLGRSYAEQATLTENVMAGNSHTRLKLVQDPISGQLFYVPDWSQLRGTTYVAQSSTLELAPADQSHPSGMSDYPVPVHSSHLVPPQLRYFYQPQLVHLPPPGLAVVRAADCEEMSEGVLTKEMSIQTSENEEGDVVTKVEVEDEVGSRCCSPVVVVNGQIPIKSPARSPIRSPDQTRVCSPARSPIQTPAPLPVPVVIRSPDRQSLTSPPVRTSTRSPITSPSRSPDRLSIRSPTSSPIRPSIRSPTSSPIRPSIRSATSSPTPSPVYSPTLTRTPAPLPSRRLSGLDALCAASAHLSSDVMPPPPLPPSRPAVDGLHLLCTAAEQAHQAAPQETGGCRSPDIDDVYNAPKLGSLGDDENLTPKKSFMFRRYSQEETSECPPRLLVGLDDMDAMETDMRMRLAELQRKYKEKQQELARWQIRPRSDSVDEKPLKRGRGRPKKQRRRSQCNKRDASTPSKNGGSTPKSKHGVSDKVPSPTKSSAIITKSKFSSPSSSVKTTVSIRPAQFSQPASCAPKTSASLFKSCDAEVKPSSAAFAMPVFASSPVVKAKATSIPFSHSQAPTTMSKSLLLSSSVGNNSNVPSRSASYKTVAPCSLAPSSANSELSTKKSDFCAETSQARKLLDMSDFCKVSKLMTASAATSSQAKSVSHLTPMSFKSTNVSTHSEVKPSVAKTIVKTKVMFSAKPASKMPVKPVTILAAKPKKTLTAKPLLPSSTDSLSRQALQSSFAALKAKLKPEMLPGKRPPPPPPLPQPLSSSPSEKQKEKTDNLAKGNTKSAEDALAALVKPSAECTSGAKEKTKSESSSVNKNTTRKTPHIAQDKCKPKSSQWLFSGWSHDTPTSSADKAMPKKISAKMKITSNGESRKTGSSTEKPAAAEEEGVRGRRDSKQMEVMRTSVAAATSAALKSKKRSKFDGSGLVKFSDDAPVKKRKPGRPKKFVLSGKAGTETIVTKKAKHLKFFAVHNKAKVQRKDASKSTGFVLTDEWKRRRSERIFLSDAVTSTTPSKPSSSRVTKPSIASVTSTITVHQDVSSSGNVSNSSIISQGPAVVRVRSPSAFHAVRIGKTTNVAKSSNVPADISRAQKSNSTAVEVCRPSGTKTNGETSKDAPSKPVRDSTTTGVIHASSKDGNSEPVTVNGVKTDVIRAGALPKDGTCNGVTRKTLNTSAASLKSDAGTAAAGVSDSALTTNGGLAVMKRASEEKRVATSIVQSKVGLKLKKPQKPDKNMKSVRDDYEFTSDSSDTNDDEDMPLSSYVEQPLTSESQHPCVLTPDSLKDGLRVLLLEEGLFFEGQVKAIHPPDIYGVVIDGERGNRPHILTQEEMLKMTVLDVKLTTEDDHHVGGPTRVCAYWSQQYSCLYPGTLARRSSPSDDDGDDNDDDLVDIEFDDGDSGRIPRDHIRLLPNDFPIQGADKQLAATPGKRRRRTVSQSLIADTPERRPSMCDTLASYQLADTLTVQDEKKATGTRRKAGKPVKLEDTERERVKGKGKGESASEDSDSGMSELEDSIEEGHDLGQNEDDEVDVEQDDADKWWEWEGKGTSRPGMRGRAKKVFYKAIRRADQVIAVGDAAVFVSTGHPLFPYIGRVIGLWQGWTGRRMVKVKWFYHAEEAKGSRKLADNSSALYLSSHTDENDVQTIAHRCEVVSYAQFKTMDHDQTKRTSQAASRSRHKAADCYYLAGTYEPTVGRFSLEADIVVL